MELVFLATLILLMVIALGAGFPVAFALPGSAIITIAMAGLSGYLFEGRVDAYFAHGDPIQWLNAGITNFRGIYWEAERDTLIAIPLFIFMGIMLERSKIAEDLLITMAQIFGPVPGGLGISVVLVGALLAATTGIVGATVIAMGLISLPVMLRNNYSHSLATGTIAASGTLGQIIPPSIVLIILADQLSNATDQASSIRTADYKLGTGLTSLPSEYDLTSTSAGDMFVGAFLPGLVLVGLYVLYILFFALSRPKNAPPTPFEGKYDITFVKRLFIVLVPPLSLIIMVLGSIVLGIATVNQAGAVGAIGAMVMAGYRLKVGERGAYTPAIFALVSVTAIVLVLSFYDINVKNIKGSDDAIGVFLAAVASTAFFAAIFWSGWRVYKIDRTLEGVMIETAKTTSLVFIILIGAAMLTAAFRAFGGEELVRGLLTGLPGGFATKFIVVMAVIFVLGFFLDFIEIAVVVVPIIAPILLADPSANVTAVWLGVMIGVNIQTSFLTPPFGFALFYLRGVAPPIVKTLEMYRGVVPFILLQLVALVIVGVFPSLVNYLPNLVYLTSETAPPPRNPRLQACLEEHLFPQYESRGNELRASIDKANALDISYLPEKYRTSLKDAFESAGKTFALVEKVRAAEAVVADYVTTYRPLHREMRELRVEVGAIDRDLKKQEKTRRFLTRDDKASDEDLRRVVQLIGDLKRTRKEAASRTPAGWDEARKRYLELAGAEKKARRLYRRNVDDAYDAVAEIRKVLSQTDALAALEDRLRGLERVAAHDAVDQAIKTIKSIESEIGAIAGASKIKSKVSRARRALKKKKPNREKATAQIIQALDLYAVEVAWRRQATERIAVELENYDNAIKDTIGLRLQERLNSEQADEIAICQSFHRDISLDF